MYPVLLTVVVMVVALRTYWLTPIYSRLAPMGPQHPYWEVFISRLVEHSNVSRSRIRGYYSLVDVKRRKYYYSHVMYLIDDICYDMHVQKPGMPLYTAIDLLELVDIEEFLVEADC